MWLDDAQCVQLIDFGLARVLDATMSRQKSIGTFSFMAPELLNYIGHNIEPKYVIFQDMWSFGATLVDCIIGCHIIDRDAEPEEIIWLETGIHSVTGVQW